MLLKLLLLWLYRVSGCGFSVLSQIGGLPRFRDARQVKSSGRTTFAHNVPHRLDQRKPNTTTRHPAPSFLNPQNLVSTNPKITQQSLDPHLQP